MQLGDAKLVVRRRGEVAPVRTARLAWLPGYAPTVGDVVILSSVDGELVVVGVLEAAAPASLELPDGAIARLNGGALEVSDPAGRLLVRYVDGTAEIAVPTGDLRLMAPTGRVRISAGVDVSIDAERDVRLNANRSVESRVAPRDAAAGDAENAEGVSPHFRLDAKRATLAAPELALRSRRASLTAGIAEVVAREVRSRATRIETTAASLETTAERVVSRAQNVVQEVSELLETRAGRMRSLVRGVYSLRSRVTTLKSKDDTAIDGRHVLLG